MLTLGPYNQSYKSVQLQHNTGMLLVFTIPAEMLWGVAQSMDVVNKLYSQSRAAQASAK